MELSANVSSVRPDPLPHPPLNPDFSADWLLDALPCGVLVLDEQGLIRRANEPAARWGGVLPAALLGRSLAETGLPPALGAVLHDAAPHEVFLPQCGQWIELTATRQPGGWVLCGHDIAPPEPPARAEAAGALSEEKYRTLFNSIDEGFCTVEVLFDAQGQATDYRFLEANPAFERQTGLAGVVGRTMRELAPTHEAFWFETYGRVVQTGEARRFEHEAAALGSFYDVYAFRTGAPAENRVAILFNDIAARKRAEAARRRSEEQFRLFVTASSDVLYRMDAGWQQMLPLDGRNVLADTAAPSITWLEANIPPAEQPAVEAAIRAAIAGPHFFALEHRVFQADGAVGWMFSRAVPVLNERGELLEWFGTATDITVRKQAEEALYRSEERLRRMMNVSHVGVLTFDLAGTLLTANDAFLDLLGYSRAEFEARTFTWQDFTPPEYEAESQRQLERIQQTGLGGPYEKEYLRRDGSRQWFMFVAAALGDGTLVEYAVNIADRKQAEAGLRVSEAKYRTLFETMDQGFGIGEVLPAGSGRPADYRWLEVNPQVERLTGMARADLLSGQTMRKVMPDLEDEWYERYERVALTGEPVRFEQYAQVLGRWFDVYVFPLDGPEPHRIALLFTNITARKQAEEALRYAEEGHREQLEQQVAARTQELRESRDLLHAIAESQSAYVTALKAIRGEDGRIVDLEYIFVNSITARLDDGRQLMSRYFSEVFPAAETSGLMDSYRCVIETGEHEDREVMYSDGRLTGWFRSNATKLGDGVLVIGEDITARKRAEQERTRNLRLLEQAEAVGGLGSWDYDLLSREFLWSDGMHRLFGLPLGQPVGPEVYLRFVVDEDRPQAEQLVHCLTTGIDCFEGTLRLRVGEQVKTVRIKSVVLHDEAGQPVRVLGVDLDISELQRLEADNLRLRLTQQRALFEAVQAAQETERRRMAESLHNGIGQMLYATKLRLDGLHAPLPGTDPALVAARREADQLLGDAIRQTRALSHELVPTVLKEFGLAAALQDISRKMSTPQLPVRSLVQFDEAAAPLAPVLQTALYRMAQELAQNIVKHARGATEASLELETMPGWVLVRAEDNGVGFAAAATESPGLGLRSIRDRVALLGGQFATGAAPAGGAYVRIRIPLPVPSGNKLTAF